MVTDEPFLKILNVDKLGRDKFIKVRNYTKAKTKSGSQEMTIP
jgi:hypothetical protein